jgi:hypothetical protein
MPVVPCLSALLSLGVCSQRICHEPVNPHTRYDVDQRHDKHKMLHYEQQRAAGYPTFPGSVEVLSLPAYSPERHASQDSSSSISTSTIVSPPPPPPATLQTSASDTSNPSSRPKRRQTLAACRPCRKRKSRVRASLTACPIAIPHLFMMPTKTLV